VGVGNIKWKGKQVLVTGICGFIGGSIAADLIRQGATVDGIDDLSVGKEEYLPEGVNYFFNGRVNKENLPKGYYDVVFHFAAPCTVLQYKDNPLEALAKANESAYSIRVFCKEQKIPYLVYASSATYYGSSTDGWNADEALFYQENFCLPTPDNIYGVSKCAEECMDALFPTVKTLALRLFPAYGAREELKGKVASVPYQFLVDMSMDIPPEIWGDGEQRRDFIYVHDVVYCVRSLVERGAIGAYNIGTGVAVSTNELVEAINVSLSKSIVPKYVPVPNYKYTKVLVSDPSKLLDMIGGYVFTSIGDAVSDMVKEMQ